MNAVDEIEAQIRESERHRTYRGYVIADIRKTFDALQNPGDWKDEINAWIPHQLFGLAAVAVEFFTCTELKIVAGPQPLTGKIRVHADGYRMGPCGDH